MENKIIKPSAVECGYGEQGIVLGNIFSIEKIKESKSHNQLFRFREECDGYWTKDLTKEEVLILLEEIKNFIEE